MSGFLFDDIVFGPVNSRRFGVSLGINLLPETMKYCSFNCIYCECGLTDSRQESRVKLYTASEITATMESKFKERYQAGLKPDNITFAGNGEPTMHPDFARIIEHTLRLRNQYFPEAKITVLSNATRLHIISVAEALRKTDNIVLKLDAGSDQMFNRINRPASPVKLNDIVERIASFGKEAIVQTLFVRGYVGGQSVDNTTEEELNQWMQHLLRIQPSSVMLYTISRETPESNLETVPKAEMEAIAQKLRSLNIKAGVF